jgi:hypothetical protein
MDQDPLSSLELEACSLKLGACGLFLLEIFHSCARKREINPAYRV